MAAVERKARIRPGETTPDGKLSLLSARCLGSCGLAPAVVFDGEVMGKVTVDRALARLQGWMGNDGRGTREDHRD
jgi:bidirectional [NiFe] hydrogenase diaphorase subunit